MFTYIFAITNVYVTSDIFDGIFLFIQLSKKYGSVFTVYFGTNKVVVLAGYKTVKEALVSCAEEFGDRDISPIFYDINQGHGMIFLYQICYYAEIANKAVFVICSILNLEKPLINIYSISQYKLYSGFRKYSYPYIFFASDSRSRFSSRLIKFPFMPNNLHSITCSDKLIFVQKFIEAPLRVISLFCLLGEVSTNFASLGNNLGSYFCSS